MKKFFKLRTMLCWIVCVMAYWFTALLYPYNFYYRTTFLPQMSFLQILLFAGITLLLGTVMFLIMQGVGAVGRYIGMKKNLIFYFLYYFVICTAYAWGTDKLLDAVKIEPNGIYLLIGFLPAMLCSIIYSYHRSHRKVKGPKQ